MKKDMQLAQFQKNKVLIYTNKRSIMMYKELSNVCAEMEKFFEGECYIWKKKN